MGFPKPRSWLNPFRRRCRHPDARRLPSRRLSLERFEDRVVPSSTILLNNVDPNTQMPLVPNWTAVGPAPENVGGTPGNLPVSGRVSGIATDPTNPNRIFVTAASGGVWRSLDGGADWTPLTLHLPASTNTLPTNTPITDAERTLNMGAIAIAPSNPNVIYAAEGEGDTLTTGSGVLVSTDGGNTWTLTGTDVLGGLSSHAIVVDNLNPNIAFVASESLFGGGIFRTLDGGATWENISAQSPVFGGSTTFTDLDIVPRTSLSQPIALYCTTGDPTIGGSINNGIYRTNNADAATAGSVTWNLSIGGSTLVPGAGPGNIQLSISAQFPSTIYAGIGSIAGGLLGVYRSLDSGTNWARIFAAPNYLGNQGFYDNTIAVSPFDPNIVVIAGQGQILITRNGTATDPNSVAFTDISAIGPAGPHVDHHAGAFDASGNYLDGDDGGLFRLNAPASAANANWVSLNGSSTSSPNVSALNTIQFNSVSLDPRNENLALGGSQDNGLARFNDNVGWTGTDTNADSGEVVYDFNNPLFAVHTYQFSAPTANDFMRYSTDGGLTWTPSATQPPNTSTAPTNTLFYPPLVEDPSLSARFFFGSDQIAVSEDAGVTWSTKYTFPNNMSQNIPGDPSTGIPPAMGGPFPITAIGVGRASGGAGVLYSAHTDGTLYQLVFFPPPNPAPKQTDWINIAPTGAAAVGVITQIIVDPQNPNTIYVVGAGGIARTQDALSGAPTWVLLNGTGPTGLPGYFLPTTIALDPKNFSDATDDILYVGGDHGVFQLANPGHPEPGQPGGSTFDWTQVGGSYDSTDPRLRGLPDVKVSQLILNTTTGILAAGTYGAGMWEIQVRGLIRGEVFQDTNGDGKLEAGEPGMSGVIVRLVNADNGVEIANTTTDANGIYQFRSLTASQLTATNYEVVEVTPAGDIETTAPLTFSNLSEQSTYDIADPNLNPATVTIGNFLAGSISGTKFEDRNDNGVRDAGEPGVGGFTIFIDSNNNGVLDAGEISTTTAANGSWSFTNLGPAVIGGNANPVTFNGTYVIREVPKVGWVQTTPLLAAITLPSGQSVTGELIGNMQTASISGTVFVDTNGDGVRESGEPGEAGVTVQAVGPGGTRTVVSAADGTYTILSLAPGTYTVTEQTPAGFVQTTPNPAPTNLPAGGTLSGFDFGNFKTVTITGSKFNDLNGNGTLDNGEPGLSGFVFDLINASTKAVLAKATSNASGVFSFASVGPLPGGTAYAITEEQQTGWTQTTPNPAAFSLSSGVNQTGLQFGNFKSYSVSGTSYLDTNSNGLQDAGEKGDGGFVIQLRQGNTIVSSTTTAADGTYSITGIGPGTFTLIELPRTGFRLSQGANGYAVNGSSGTNLTGDNFGNVNQAILVFAQDAGGQPTVTIRDASTQAVIRTFNAYAASFSGGVRVATGQFGGAQSEPDVVTAPGPRGGPDIRVFDTATGGLVAEFMAYSTSFTGGVYVAVGDVNRDGVPDIITGADAGGGPHVEVFDGASLLSGKVKMLYSFFAYGATFAGGVRVASADVDGDGYADIITAAGPSGGPHVEVFSGRTGTLIRSFFAYASNFTGGVYVAAGDVNGDGLADIITGPGLGGGPHLRVFDGATGGLIDDAFAFPATSSGGQLSGNTVWTSGLRVGAIDLNLDGRSDIIVAPGAGQSPQFKVLDSLTLTNLLPASEETLFDPTFLGGIFVAGD